MANGETDYVKIATFAKLGEEVIALALATGLVVRRQKPGRKPEVEKAAGPKPAKVAGPQKAKAKAPTPAKPAPAAEAYDDPDEVIE